MALAIRYEHCPCCGRWDMAKDPCACTIHEVGQRINVAERVHYGAGLICSFHWRAVEKEDN